MRRSRPLFMRPDPMYVYLGPGEPEPLTEQAVTDLLGRVVRVETIHDERFYGRAFRFAEGLLVLRYAEGLARRYVNLSNIHSIQEMPEPAQGSAKELLQSARMHYDSAVSSVEDGDTGHWSVAACVQDVRDLTDLLDILTREVDLD